VSEYRPARVAAQEHARVLVQIIEVSETTLKQDEGKKLLAYQNAGISEYWIVDVAAKAVRIHRLNQAKTYSEETHSKDTIALQAFPDVTIDLGNLF